MNKETIELIFNAVLILGILTALYSFGVTIWIIRLLCDSKRVEELRAKWREQHNVRRTNSKIV